MVRSAEFPGTVIIVRQNLSQLRIQDFLDEGVDNPGDGTIFLSNNSTA